MTLDTKAEFLDAIATAKTAASSYYNNTGDSPLSDEEYDLLVDQIEAAAERHGWTESQELTDSVAAGTAVIEQKVAHARPMLSLAKFKDLDEVVKFAASLTDGVVLEPKLDGNAIALEYVGGKLVRASTRGNGAVGENITQALLGATLVDIPKQVSEHRGFEVRGELYMAYADFDALNASRDKAGEALFKHPRSVVAGVLHSSDAQPQIRLSLGVYDVDGSWIGDSESYTDRLAFAARLGFTPAADLAPQLAAKIDVRKLVEDFGAARDAKALPMPTDGIVLKANDYREREELGEAHRHPRWALAYKYESEVAIGVLDKIERAIGKSGRVSYVAVLVEPVILDNTEVQRATLNNMEYIREKGLRLGDSVYIRKANDIIPEITGVLPVSRGAEPYEAPTTCPTCGVELDRSSVMWVCHTPACRLVPRIVDAFARKNLDADGWSRATIAALAVSQRYAELEDIYTVTKPVLAETVLGKNRKTGSPVRVGEERAAKLMASLAETKTRSLELVLAAPSIPSLGSSTSKLLVRQLGSWEAIKDASVEKLAAIHGIGDISAQNIVDGIREHMHTFERFQKLGFAAFTQQSKAVGTTFRGMKLVITGTIEGMSRTDLTRKLEDEGATVSSSVSKNTDWLIYGENAGSKLAKAQSLNVKAIPADKFIAEFLR